MALPVWPLAGRVAGWLGTGTGAKFTVRTVRHVGASPRQLFLSRSISLHTRSISLDSCVSARLNSSMYPSFLLSTIRRITRDRLEKEQQLADKRQTAEDNHQPAIMTRQGLIDAGFLTPGK